MEDFLQSYGPLLAALITVIGGIYVMNRQLKASKEALDRQIIEANLNTQKQIKASNDSITKQLSYSAVHHDILLLIELIGVLNKCASEVISTIENNPISYFNYEESLRIVHSKLHIIGTILEIDQHEDLLNAIIQLNKLTSSEIDDIKYYNQVSKQISKITGQCILIAKQMRESLNS